MKYPKSNDISKKCEGTIEDKLRLIDGFNTRDILYIYQDITKAPEEFDDEIIIRIICRLYRMGVRIDFVEKLMGQYRVTEIEV